MKRRIVSFSLWGDNPLYVNGALENARMYPEMFPGWTCRFYVDQTTVSQDTISKLTETGADVYLMGRSIDVLGMYWRFRPMFDSPDVEYMLSRDTDSRPTLREKALVDEWIESEKTFHIVRDKEVHNVTILGGTWGAKPSRVPYFEKFYSTWFSQIPAFPENPRGIYHGTDQMFLHVYIWPMIKDDHIAHIRKGFPKLSYAPENEIAIEDPADGHYVGMVC
jgi:hypothetical protein